MATIKVAFSSYKTQPKSFKSMKTFTLLLTIGLLLMGCNNEDLTMDSASQQPGEAEILTTFNEVDSATRTTGSYYDHGKHGRGLLFYWSAGDKIFVNDGTKLNQSVKDNINGSPRKETASFSLPGNYTKTFYRVRYTGKNGSPNKVVIAATQMQESPNDAQHIGKDGDCGIAVAHRQGKKYLFTLTHEASYATFVPYNRYGPTPSVCLRGVKVKADQAICGTFNFTDYGLDLGSRPVPTSTNKSINMPFNFFLIPYSHPVADTTVTMVVAPGEYTNFTVEYSVYDIFREKFATLTKKYPGKVTFTKGKNKRISQDLPLMDDNYYMWDAGNDYWMAHKKFQPTRPNYSDGSYPRSWDHLRWYNNIKGYTDYSGTAPAVLPMFDHFKRCPNVNEIYWYVKYGDPHWDNTTPWFLMGEVYTGGMWLRKSSKIPGFSKTHAPDKTTDYTRSTEIAQYCNLSVAQGKPANVDDYFFLPASGHYYKGMFNSIPSTGYYWTSTPYPFYSEFSYSLNFSHNFICITGNGRDAGFRIWKAQ